MAREVHTAQLARDPRANRRQRYGIITANARGETVCIPDRAAAAVFRRTPPISPPDDKREMDPFEFPLDIPAEFLRSAPR